MCEHFRLNYNTIEEEKPKLNKKIEANGYNRVDTL